MIQYERRDGSLMMIAEEWLPAEAEQAALRDASDAARLHLPAVFRQLREHEEHLNRKATAEQRDIRWGGYARLTVTFPMEPTVTIWGRVRTLGELMQAEERLGAGAAEIMSVMGTIREGHRRGWRHGTWYSVITPEGEIGSHHIGALTPVTEAEFNAARARGWTES